MKEANMNIRKKEKNINEINYPCRQQTAESMERH